ncbi:hypothetical protein ACFU0X_19635 [Streptomyces cellulosae]|uniref:Uncharacterized protein n=1 Tax=Streptomyces cellulosae TaxID=1968 RepID=A0ABW6JJL4_STRCE
MTKAERVEWADEALQVHVQNTVESWWEVVDDAGREVPVELDAPDDEEVQDEDDA